MEQHSPRPRAGEAGPLMEAGGSESLDATANSVLSPWGSGLPWGVKTEAQNLSSILETGLWLLDGEWVRDGKV